MTVQCTCHYVHTDTSVHLSDGGICRRSDAEEVWKAMLKSETQSVKEGTIGSIGFAKKFSKQCLH